MLTADQNVDTSKHTVPSASDIAAATEMGYTVHGPDEADTNGETKWAFCIEGDYSEEYLTEADAWAAAVADMPFYRAAVADMAAMP